MWPYTKSNSIVHIGLGLVVESSHSPTPKNNTTVWLNYLEIAPFIAKVPKPRLPTGVKSLSYKYRGTLQQCDQKGTWFCRQKCRRRHRKKASKMTMTVSRALLDSLPNNGHHPNRGHYLDIRNVIQVRRWFEDAHPDNIRPGCGKVFPVNDTKYW